MQPDADAHAKLRAVFDLSPAVMCITGLDDGRIRAQEKLVDGVGCMHPAGRVLLPSGEELEIWADTLALPPDQLAR